MKSIILDNNGETFDRYTIIDPATGDMWGASHNPFSPMGFGQYCGNIADNYWRVAYGYGWRNGLDKRLLNARIKFAINKYLAETKDKPVKLEELPEPVQQYVKQVMEPESVN